MSSQQPPLPWFSSIPYNPTFFSSTYVTSFALNNRNYVTGANVQSQLFNIASSSNPPYPSLAPVSPINSLTQVLITGTVLFKGQSFSKFVFFPITTVTAVPLRFALYDASWNLVVGSDVGGWNNVASSTSGTPITMSLASSITIQITGNYYIWCNSNVAIPVNSYWASASIPTGILNMTSNTTDVLANGSTPVKIGTLNGITSASIPPSSIAGFTITYGSIVPLFILRI